jgi:hypothetical protein
MAVSGHKTEKAFKKYIKVEHIKKARMIKNSGKLSPIYKWKPGSIK